MFKTFNQIKTECILRIYSFRFVLITTTQIIVYLSIAFLIRKSIYFTIYTNKLNLSKINRIGEAINMINKYIYNYQIKTAFLK